jgi:predicted aconitase
MHLTEEEESMLSGEHGNAVRKSMEILVALGKIYGAEKLIDVKSVQVAGVSYHNLGDAGLEFLNELAQDGKVRVLTTLNPAGMDLENWQELGIPEEFAKKQMLVIEAFRKMGIQISCTCTPYLIGNTPTPGEHVAWSESSAVVFANSVLGARTNREGGPSALAAALTGKTPAYGLHLDENRKPDVTVDVDANLEHISDWGALGYCLGKKAENKIAYIRGINSANLDQLKSLSASCVTYGTKPLFHIDGITPETHEAPADAIRITQQDIDEAYKAINDEESDVDFVSLGCPHASLEEIKMIADFLRGKRIAVEFWVTTARTTKRKSDEAGYSKTIEDAGGKFACDTCLAVAPLKGRFKVAATNSAKGCFYAHGSNKMKTRFGTIEQCLNAAVTGKWK